MQPDTKFVIVSVRDDKAFKINSPIKHDQTIDSDSILSYRIDQNNGTLSLACETPAGGSSPRQFSLNRIGDRIAIVQQKNGWVSIFDRNPGTAEIGELLAFKDGFGEMGPVCVLWDIESE
jgi:6-phosphogluconolactonase (cycloisomerase 2 family)